MHLVKRLGPVLAFALAGCGPNTEFASSGSKETRNGANVERTSKTPGPKAPETKKDPVRLSQEFLIADRSPVAFGYDPETKSVEQKVTLARRIEARETTLQQIDRPTRVKLFKQGSPGSNKTETFVQAQSGLLDVQVVVDNSGSMKEEQTNLASKLAALLTSIKDRNWRINVVTTDAGQALPPAKTCSRAIINRGDANAETAFKEAVNAGTTGAGNERGILMAVEGLKCPTTPWVRAGSKIAVLIVSDEDNCSDGKGCGADAWNKPDYLLSYLRDTLKRPLGTDSRVYGIYWTPNTTCATGGNQAVQYHSTVSQTSGTYGSICDADYTATLKKISSDVAAILKADYSLASVPDAGSVRVFVDGVLKTTGYSVAGKVVTFSQVPPEAAQIKIEYVVGTTPTLTRFPLGEMPAPATLSVLVNGAVAAVASYAVDAATRELVFSAAPPANADVKATYRSGGELPRSFDLGAGVQPKAGTLKAKVDDQDVAASFAGSVVTLDKTPADGAALVFTYDALLEPILSYKVAEPGVQVVDYVVRDAATAQPVPATLAGGVVTFPADAFVEDRVISVSYRDEESLEGEFTLPSPPLDGTLKIEGYPCGLETTTITGRVLAFDCDLKGIPHLEARYETEAEAQRVFVLPGWHPGLTGTWSVTVDGEDTTDFVADGGMVIMGSKPHGGSRVKVSFLEG